VLEKSRSMRTLGNCRLLMHFVSGLGKAFAGIKPIK
jgi:hypothetical protein